VQRPEMDEEDISVSFDLCMVQQAARPYFIENISTNIYSIEELCFYLYRNVYLIDATIINEALCDWIRDELGLKKLYRLLYDQLDQGKGVEQFILPIFREIGYLDGKQMKEYQEKLSRLRVQPEDERQKLKGDYLVRCGMFENAVNEYRQIIDRQGPGSLGAGFYSGIWNNLGCACARMFRFEEAGECFYQAWKLGRTRETLRKYVSVLALYMDEEAYRKKLEKLGADKELIHAISEYNAEIAREASESAKQTKPEGTSIKEELRVIKDEYRRSANCLLYQEDSDLI